MEKIKEKTKPVWKREVRKAVEKTNRKRLEDECHETTPEGKRVKSKTSYVHKKLIEDNYQRKPMYPIAALNQIEAKTLILARFRMLECGKNFRGTSPETCSECNEIDDESHRLNSCSRFRQTNLCNSSEKAEFTDVYSNDIETVKNILYVCNYESLEYQKWWNELNYLLFMNPIPLPPSIMHLSNCTIAVQLITYV